MIALIDYGAGNLTSVRKALTTLNTEFSTPQSPGELQRARGIVVPGVGHFGATHALDDAWRAAIEESLDRGAALFGICLGMQWLFEGSDEAPDARGLGLIAGRCTRIDPTGSTSSTFVAADAPRQTASPTRRHLKVPHVGWNSLAHTEGHPLMHGVPSGTQVYFTHSYIAPVVAESAAITTYGVPFSSAVERGRIAGVQFHPEKSGDFGLRILENWLHAV